MTHLVETMAYTNETPWHGLGHYVAEAPSVKKMLELAQLNWKVERKPMTIDGREVPGFAALVRDRDGSVLDVVGSRYTPSQNAEVFEFFNEFVEAGGATMETAGALRGGRYVWGLASLNAKFKMRNNDVVKGYLLLVNPHEQGKSLIVRFTPVRVVCNNTLTLALRTAGQEFRMNHRNAFDQTMIARAKETLDIARDQLGEFERNARLLQKLNLSRADAIRILAPVYQPDTDPALIVGDFNVAKPRMKSVMDILERAPGAEPNTGWGVLNAVTYYADHVASRSDDKRLTNAWLGRTAGQKETVLEKLLELAA